MQEVKHKGQDSHLFDPNSVNLPLKGSKSSRDKSIFKKPRKVSFGDNLNDLKQKREREKVDTSTEERNNPAANVEDDDSGVPYDRGWAWVVDLACFMLCFVYVSHDQWHSVLLLDYMQEFDIPVTLVTVMMSLGSLCYCLATQISTNILVKKYSIRIVITVAAILNVMATLLLAAIPNIAIFYIANFIKYAVKGLTLIACLILVGFYFRRRRGLATTLTLLGISMSAICAPPMIRYLREEYGFRGCFLLLAGFEMHAIIAALLLRPINSYKRKRASPKISTTQTEESNPLIANSSNSQSEDKEPTENAVLIEPTSHTPIGIAEIAIEEGDETRSDPSDAKTNCVGDNKAMVESINNELGQMSSVIKSSTIENTGEHWDKNYVNDNTGQNMKNDFEKSRSPEKVSTDFGDKNHEVQKNMLKDKKETINETQQDVVLIEETADTSTMQINSNSPTDPHVAHEETHKPSDHVRVKRASSSSLHLEVPIPRSYRSSNWSLVSASAMSSTLTLAHVMETEPSAELTPKAGHRLSSIKDIFDVSVLKNYLAIMVAAMYVMVNVGGLTSTYLPSYARKVGVSRSNAALLLTVVGSMDVIGRLFFGFFADLKLVPPRFVVVVTSVCIGTVTQFLFLFTGFEQLIFFSVVHGLLAGAGQNLITVIIVDEVGINYLGKLLPFCSMFTSISFIIQHPINGLAIQATGNFLVTFHYVGTVFLLAALLLLLEPVIRRLQVAKERKQQKKQ